MNTFAELASLASVIEMNGEEPQSSMLLFINVVHQDSLRGCCGVAECNTCAIQVNAEVPTPRGPSFVSDQQSFAKPTSSISPMHFSINVPSQ